MPRRKYRTFNGKRYELITSRLSREDASEAARFWEDEHGCQTRITGPRPSRILTRKAYWDVWVGSCRIPIEG